MEYKTLNTAGKTATAIRYTRDAWKALFQNDRTDSEYEKNNMPGQIREFAEKTAERFEKQTGQKLDCVKVITLDNDFVKFSKKKENQGKALSELVSEYVPTVTDRRATNKLLKYGMNVQYTVAALQVVLQYQVAVPSEQNYCLDAAAAKLVMRYLEKLYGAGNVFVPGYVMDLHSFEDGAENLVRFAESYFTEGQNIRYGMWNKQALTHGNIQIVYIPFVTRYAYDSAIIEIEPEITVENLSLQPDDLILSADDFATYGLSHVKMITEERVGEKLTETFGRQVFRAVAPVITRPEEAREQSNMMLLGIAREMKKKFGDKRSKR